MKAIKLNLKVILTTIFINLSTTIICNASDNVNLLHMLPADIIRYIASNLNANDTISLRETCRYTSQKIDPIDIHSKRLNEGGAFYKYEKGSYLPAVGAELIEIQEDFELGDLTTQEAWVEVMGENPSKWNTKEICPEDYIPNYKGTGISVCKNWPVTNVTGGMMQIFIQKLNERNPQYNYRLPTEQEYEYAARGGKQADPSIYTGTFGRAGFEDFAEYRDIANVDSKRSYEQGPGKINQNPGFPRLDGAHDLLGTLYSWTSTECESGASALVIRGCVWVNSQVCVRAARRFGCCPSGSYDCVGLRLLRTSSQNWALEPLTLSSSSNSLKCQKKECVLL